jgi:anhydro-N-acetylmuramic acid kinase
VAVGSHGQTLRHQTFAAPTPGLRFTYQIGDPNTIAELTGIDVVADFRRRDIAAGGEAAPLAPGFHYHFFSHPQIVRAVVNIGGFSNASLLVPDEAPVGFDTGPGNCLLDGWVYRHLKLPFDQDGSWAAQGKVNAELLSRLKSHPYFGRTVPKSTGRELFNLSWVDAGLADRSIEPVDVQSTLMQLTVETLFEGLKQARQPIEEIYICGGGAQNPELMTRLENASGLRVQTTAALGVDPRLVEGCAFAWMAQRTLQGLPANLPSVTGAKGPRILGGIFRA